MFRGPAMMRDVAVRDCGQGMIHQGLKLGPRMSDVEIAVPEIMTVEEVAQRLRCSKAHVCNAINGKVNGVTTLPTISMGRRKLIRVSALAAWLAQNELADSNAMIPACGIEAVGASKGKHDA